MVYQWEPETQYNLGDVVEYEGHKYKIVQPHMSQADWTPPATPALWARLPEEYRGDDQQIHGDGQYQQQQQQQSYGGYSDNNDEKRWDEHQTQKVDIPQEEQEKHWYDLDEKRKKQLEVGGGLAAGLALLAGGYAAYKHHERTSEDEKKANVWGVQSWLRDAQARTEAYHRTGLPGPVGWVLVHGSNIPHGAIQGGEENGQPLFISRAFYEGSIQVGKASPTLPKGASIGFGHNEISVDTYELLVGNPNAVHWVEDRGHLSPDKLGATPVEGGRDADGTPLFIAQARYHDTTQPGKCSTRLDGAFIPYGGTEKKINDYRVLCYNN